MRKLSLIMLVPVFLLGAACTNKDKSSLVTPGSSSGAAGVEVSATMRVKPTVTLPTGAPPSTPMSKDIVVGTGETATAQTPIVVHYVGISWSTGKQFDASWDRGSPFPTTLQQVIPGWTMLIPGMKVGGRRLLIIPPQYGYGAAGSPPVIAPNETLVFVVDLLSVQAAPGASAGATATATGSY